MTRLLLLSALAICATVCFAAPATAATYTVYACTGPSDEALPNSSWLTSVEDPGQTLSYAFGANCGDLSVHAKPSEHFHAGDGAGYVFDPPAGTTIAGYRLTRAATVDFPKLDIFRPSLTAGIREGAGALAEDRDCDAVVTDCAREADVVEHSGLSLGQLSIGVHCVESAEAGCAPWSFEELSTQLAEAAVDVDDSAAPKIFSVVGSLPGSSSPAGLKSTGVTANDVGGGVRTIQISIDGGDPIAKDAGGSCGEPYTLRQPCPSGLVRNFNFDTSQLTNGEHSVAVSAIDAAGNVSVVSSFRFTVTSGGVSGGGGSIPTNGSPAVQQPTVKLDDSLISAATGKEVLVDGVLTTLGGAPISGAVLDVTSLDLGVFGAQPVSIGSITTSGNGHFSVKLKPHGAHRISVLFKPTPDSLGTAVATAIVREDLKLSIKRSKSHVKPKGSLTLTGRLTGAGSASGDAPVEIDARVGGKWRAVSVVATNSKGSWKWRYRFTRVTSATRFTFRAIVRRNKTWPWPNEASDPVKVLVSR